MEFFVGISGASANGALRMSSCPSLPRDPELVVQLLHKACLKLGGEEALAHHLGLALGLIRMWLKGQGHPPDDVFLKCVDLLEGNPT